MSQLQRTITRMQLHSFQDLRPPRTCWHCSAYGGLTAGGTAALCNRAGCCRVRSGPAHGCVCWEREPGTDDSPEPPSDFAGTVSLLNLSQSAVARAADLYRPGPHPLLG